MIIRLASLTLLLGLFAYGFSSLATKGDEHRFAFSGHSSCYDQGIVCAPQTSVR
ncbi:hypothetical protein [Aureimonas frigidaquae]|uniref:hypothetical protein n=1 Tax=Aureimonas frigidaquae TaxID=424757 RepID=UPI000ACB12BC|nr:hypothetical protein [Aureimonas frigidaquae]